MSTSSYRQKHPLRYAYQTLKDNAKRRCKEFNLTFEEFKEFAIKTKYITKKGIQKESYHIDRIDEKRGYMKDNIQLLTNIDNRNKYLQHWWDEKLKKYMFTTVTNKEVEKENCPF